MGDEAFFLGSYAPMKITRKPSDYLKMMYMDRRAITRPRPLRHRHHRAGRIVFGSDAPNAALDERPGDRDHRQARIAGREHEQIIVRHGQAAAQALKCAG